MLQLKRDVDDQATQPMDLRYMKMLRSILSFIHSWPYYLYGVKRKSPPFFRNTVTMFIEGAFVCLGGLAYVKTNFYKVTFLEMGNTYLTVLLSTVATQRVTINWFQSYHKLMKQFLMETHLFYYRHKTEFSEQVYQRVHRICHIFTIYSCTIAVLGITIFNLTPLFNNYMKGMFSKNRPADLRFEHAIEYIVPNIDQHHDMKAYICVAMANLVFSFDCAIFYSAFDITISLIVFHIWGHLKILDNNLRSIQTPTEMRKNIPGGYGDELKYTDEENLEIATILKNNVEHHKMIKSMMNITSQAFGLTMLVYYMFHQISGCFLLLECSQDTKSLIRYGPVTVTLFQFLIQMSIIVELLGSQSEELKDAVYSVPWEYMNGSNRKVVLFFLCNVQEPIRLKPLGMFSVGVQTMATIIKTTLSYFMLLRTFTQD